MKQIFIIAIISLVFLMSCTDDPVSPPVDSFINGTWSGIYKADADSAFFAMTIKNDKNVSGTSSVFVLHKIFANNTYTEETLEQNGTIEGTFAENILEIKYKGEAEYIFKGSLSADSSQFNGHINIYSLIAEKYVQLNISVKHHK